MTQLESESGDIVHFKKEFECIRVSTGHVDADTLTLLASLDKPHKVSLLQYKRLRTLEDAVIASIDEMRNILIEKGYTIPKLEIYPDEPILGFDLKTKGMDLKVWI